MGYIEDKEEGEKIMNIDNLKLECSPSTYYCRMMLIILIISVFGASCALGNDGIIDKYDKDKDNDGIRDIYDKDFDNDGISNRYDRDIDNDGILDIYDKDNDNDGISNRYDRDHDY